MTNQWICRIGNVVYIQYFRNDDHGKENIEKSNMPPNKLND